MKSTSQQPRPRKMSQKPIVQEEAKSSQKELEHGYLGIDFGTSVIVVSILTDKTFQTPTLVEDYKSDYYIKSIIGYKTPDSVFIGDKALSCKPHLTIIDNKRFIGKDFKKVESFIGNYSCPVLEDEKTNGVRYELKFDDDNSKFVTPGVIATHLLVYVNNLLESKYPGVKWVNGVITVPGYYSARSIGATLQAGMLVFSYVLFWFFILIQCVFA